MTLNGRFLIQRLSAIYNAFAMSSKLGMTPILDAGWFAVRVPRAASLSAVRKARGDIGGALFSLINALQRDGSARDDGGGG